jgi:hypothetical protein
VGVVSVMYKEPRDLPDGALGGSSDAIKGHGKTLATLLG